MQMDFRGRQKNLREELERRKVDALVVTHLPNVRYLCGFTGSAGVLLAAGVLFSLPTEGIRRRPLVRSKALAFPLPRVGTGGCG